MAITQETMRLAADMRRTIRDMTDEQALDLTRSWVSTWDTLQPEIEEALLELAAEYPERVPRSALQRSRRLASALEQAQDALQALYERMEADLIQASTASIQEAIAAQLRLIETQLPPEGMRNDGTVSLSLNQPNPAGVNALVLRTTEMIHSQTIPLAPWVAGRMKDTLMQGFILGENPRTVARRIIKATEDQFNGGLARALNISRTEFLDANRRAARLASMQNAEILTGWVWMATLDSRTCPSCLANHGTFHPVDKFGPDDHQQGRCARVDKTKTWKELGFDIEEAADQFPDAREWYDGLTEDTQVRIMGPTRQRLLDEGKIGWDDLSTNRPSSAWRDSQGVTPVKDLLEKAGA